MGSCRGLHQALKEVKFAEKAQLDRTSQVEPFRVTLFDLIAEKERRRRAHSPPPVPPKPSRRTTRGVETSIPKTVEALRPTNLFHPETPGNSKKSTVRVSDDSKTPMVITKMPYVRFYRITILFRFHLSRCICELNKQEQNTLCRDEQSHK